MRSTLLILTAVVFMCATGFISDCHAFRNEEPPTWLPVPVAGIRPSQLYDSWGAPRSDNRRHEGIDIMARRGTPVLSVSPGIVSSVQERDLGGNTVSVYGPGGYSHYYAHLDSYGRYVEGDRVNIGDTLGFVGNTGNAKGGPTHLHYGIYTDTGAINPYPLLVAKKPGVAADSSVKKPAGKNTKSRAASKKGEIR